MYDYDLLYQLMERTVHKYSQFEKQNHTYPGGITLTHAELHTIECIGDHSGLNLTKLANLKGITKSGASQMVYRLRDKGLVKKEISSHSDAAISLCLTDVGEKIYKGHESYHKSKNNQFLERLKQVPEGTAKEMEQILLDFDCSIDEWMKEKNS